MGNNHSTQNSSGSLSSSSTSSSSSSDKYKTQIVDLDGKLLVDLKNRNVKKLKPQLFYSLFETVEIMSADSLCNSEYMKNRPTGPVTITTTTLITGDSEQITLSSPTGSQTETTDDKMNDTSTPILDNVSFDHSSPVPSPKSSMVREHYLNPDINLEKGASLTLDEQTNSITITKPHRSHEFKSNPIEGMEASTSAEARESIDSHPNIIKRSQSDIDSKPGKFKANPLTASTPGSASSSNSNSPSSSKKSKLSSSTSITTSSKSSSSKYKQPSLEELLTLKNKYNIHSVDLSINRLDSIQDEVLKIISHFNVKELNISTNFFNIVPNIQQIKSLTNINLSKNKITRIPILIFSELPLLSILNLDKNYIPIIPDDIDKLKNLKYFSIRSNSIESLPLTFCNLENLISFDISYNKLKSLPNNFDSLKNLRMCWFTCNSLTQLPSMKNLTNLCILDVSSNKLTSISKDLSLLAPKAKEVNDKGDYELIEGGGLGSLKELNIRDNRDLISLPCEFKMVELTLNLLTSIPTEIIPGLFLGGLDSANNISIMQTLKITHVVLAIGDLTPFFPKLFKYYTIDDARDSPLYDLSVHFEHTNSFIEQGRKAGGVLVHCRAGISRSSTLIIAYLMKYHNMSFKKATSFVQSKRPQILPNSGFREQLLKYEAKLLCNK